MTTPIRRPGGGPPPTREWPPMQWPPGTGGNPGGTVDHDPDADNPPGSGGTTTAGRGAGTTTISGAIAGDPNLTSATTTAVAPRDSAADAADDDLQAFFSTGTGPAQHYHVISQEPEPIEAETVKVSRSHKQAGRAQRKAAKKAKKGTTG